MKITIFGYEKRLVFQFNEAETAADNLEKKFSEKKGEIKKEGIQDSVSRIKNELLDFKSFGLTEGAARIFAQSQKNEIDQEIAEILSGYEKDKELLILDYGMATQKIKKSLDIYKETELKEIREKIKKLQEKIEKEKELLQKCRDYAGLAVFGGIKEDYFNLKDAYSKNSTSETEDSNYWDKGQKNLKVKDLMNDLYYEFYINKKDKESVNDFAGSREKIIKKFLNDSRIGTSYGEIQSVAKLAHYLHKVKNESGCDFDRGNETVEDYLARAFVELAKNGQIKSFDNEVNEIKNIESEIAKMNEVKKNDRSEIIKEDAGDIQGEVNPEVGEQKERRGADKIESSLKTATMSTDATLSTGEKYKVEVKSKLHVRDDEGKVVSKLDKGEEVILADNKVKEAEGHKFVHIKRDDGDKWVAGEYLEKKNSDVPDKVPAVTSVPNENHGELSGVKGVSRQSEQEGAAIGSSKNASSRGGSNGEEAGIQNGDEERKNGVIQENLDVRNYEGRFTPERARIETREGRIIEPTLQSTIDSYTIGEKMAIIRSIESGESIELSLEKKLRLQYLEIFAVYLEAFASEIEYPESWTMKVGKWALDDAQESAFKNFNKMFFDNFDEIKNEIISSDKRFDEIINDFFPQNNKAYQSILTEISASSGINFMERVWVKNDGTQGEFKGFDQEHLMKQYGNLVKNLRKFGRYDEAKKLMESVLGDEFKKYTEKLETDNKDANTKFNQELHKEADEIITRDVAKYEHDWKYPSEEMKTKGAVAMTQDQVNDYKQALLEEKYQELLYKKASYNISRDDKFIAGLSGEKKELWSQYEDMLDPGEKFGEVKDATWDTIWEEVIVNAPLLLASFGVANVVSAGAKSLATRVLAKQAASFGAKSIARRAGVRVVGFAGEMALEGAAFEAVHTGMLSILHQENLYKQYEGLPGFLKSAVMSGAFIKAFHVGNKIGESLFSKQVFSAAEGKMVSVPRLLGKYTSKIPNKQAEEFVKLLIAKGHIEAALMTLPQIASHFWDGKTTNEFYEEFGDMLIHSYVSVGVLKVEGGAFRSMTGKVFKPMKGKIKSSTESTGRKVDQVNEYLKFKRGEAKEKKMKNLRERNPVKYKNKVLDRISRSLEKLKPGFGSTEAYLRKVARELEVLKSEYMKLGDLKIEGSKKAEKRAEELKKEIEKVENSIKEDLGKIDAKRTGLETKLTDEYIEKSDVKTLEKDFSELTKERLKIEEVLKNDAEMRAEQRTELEVQAQRLAERQVKVEEALKRKVESGKEKELEGKGEKAKGEEKMQEEAVKVFEEVSVKPKLDEIKITEFKEGKLNPDKPIGFEFSEPVEIVLGDRIEKLRIFEKDGNLFLKSSKVEMKLEDGIFRVGRDPKGNNIVFEDARISGNHVEIRVQGRKVEIKDLGSTNGTKVETVSELSMGRETIGSSYSEIRVVKPKLAEAVMKNLQINGSEFKGEKLTAEYLQSQGLSPKYEVIVDGKSYLFSSNAYNFRGRIAVVGYVQNSEGAFVARTYYLSHSSGSWRYLPEYTLKDGEINWFSKGFGEESIGLPSEIQMALANISSSNRVLEIKNPELVFMGTGRQLEAAYEAGHVARTYFIEVRQEPRILEGNLKSKLKYDKVNPEEIGLKNVQENPDYSKVVAKYTQRSNLYGEVEFTVHDSFDGNLRFIFAKDSMNRVWISQIEDISTKEIGSTGLRPTWVNGHDLQTPAYEYESQSGSFGNNSKVNGEYVDMFQNYLSKVPMIREFMREHRIPMGE